MPGMIDAHTHIGISEESVRSEGEDCNEITDPVTPQMRAIDGIYPSENAFVRAVEAGVTSAVIGPGSANVIGGQMCFAKLWGDRIDDMIVKAPCAMKMALGENPKRCYGSHKTPQTRMASAFSCARPLSRPRDTCRSWKRTLTARRMMREVRGAHSGAQARTCGAYSLPPR